MANAARRGAIEAVCSIEGITQIGDDGFVQFITDEDALMKLLIDVCYDKVD